MNDGMWVEGYFILKDELPEELISKASPVKIRKFSANVKVAHYLLTELKGIDHKRFVEQQVGRVAEWTAREMLDTPNTCTVATYAQAAEAVTTYELSFYILAKGWGYRA